MLFQFASYALLIVAPVLATNTAGDPTDLSNWPNCAQNCIPRGLGPPTYCGSLSNTTCICQQGVLTSQIADCEQTTCSQQGLRDIQTLSVRLCAQVGGIGSAVSAAASSFYSTRTFSRTTTPTTAPSVTATPSPISGVGSAGDLSNYPLCAQVCNNETIAITQASADDINDYAFLCSPAFRAQTSGCIAATCSAGDAEATNRLGTQFCSRLYAANATLSSEASAATASASAAAVAATRGKDATNPASFPECGQPCVSQNNYNGCGSFTNLECICQGRQFNASVAPCQRANCNDEDFQTIGYLAEVLCAPVGGVGTHPIDYNGTGNGTATNTTAGSPSPSPFTGGARQTGGGVTGMIVTGLASVVALLML